jgi:hypothetical protein
MDAPTPEIRLKITRGMRSKNTGEWALRYALPAMGVGFDFAA